MTANKLHGGLELEAKKIYQQQRAKGMTIAQAQKETVEILCAKSRQARHTKTVVEMFVKEACTT